MSNLGRADIEGGVITNETFLDHEFEPTSQRSEPTNPADRLVAFLVSFGCQEIHVALNHVCGDLAGQQASPVSLLYKVGE